MIFLPPVSEEIDIATPAPQSPCIEINDFTSLDDVFDFLKGFYSELGVAFGEKTVKIEKRLQIFNKVSYFFYS